MENWYDSMPRIKRAGKYDFRPSTNGGAGGGGIRIDSHFKSSHCVVCGLESTTGMSIPGSPLIYLVHFLIFPIILPRFSLTIQRSAPNALPTHLVHPIPCSPGLTSLNPD